MTLKLRIQSHVRSLIANRRRMIKRGFNNRNEMEMQMTLNSLEYWNANLKNDKAAAQFMMKRYELLKSILPHKQDRLEPDGIEELRTFVNEAQCYLQPQQLNIFNQD